MITLKLLSVGTNAKTVKSDKLGEYLTAILYLLPVDLSGKNICPYSSPACRQACLNTAGRGVFNTVQQARLKKTEFFHKDKKNFLNVLYEDIRKFSFYCENQGLKACIRLNGTSDIPFEKHFFNGKNIFEHFPDLQFYDYTKWPYDKRLDLPENYHLTYSLKETDDPYQMIVNNYYYGKRNTAVVFRDELPENFQTFPVLSGDNHDLRFLDPKGYVIGLKAKGKAKFDHSGFVIDLPNAMTKFKIA